MEPSSNTPSTSTENEEAPRQVLGYSNQAPSPNIVIWCRLLAIGMLALGIERFAELLTYAFVGNRYRMTYVVMSLAVATLWPAIAWYCWVQAPVLAMRISRGSATSTGAENTDVSTEILSVSLLVLGVYEVMESLSFVTMIVPVGQSFHNLSDLPWGGMFGPLLRLAIGLALIFRNHVATAYLRRVSRAPNPDVE
jgi:hypothetical protein